MSLTLAEGARSESPGSTLAKRVIQSRLSGEISLLTPQFVDDQESGGRALPAAPKQIKDDCIKLLAGEGPGSLDYYSGLILVAISKGYILVALPGPTLYHHALVDIDAGELIELPFAVWPHMISGDRIVYIGDANIAVYKLGEGLFREIPEARLPKELTYDKSGGDGEFFIPVLTGNGDTITVSIFDRRRSKIRDVSYRLP
jgi:hypothetical protein